MDIQERIERFAKMAEADPENELGHLSLGKALAEAGRLDEALTALHKVTDLNPEFSKAYQELATVQLGLDDQPAAVATLRRGIEIADQRGDLMPRDQMVSMLTDLGETPPEVSASRPAAVATSGTDLNCTRCGRPSRRMEKAPFKGELGQRVWDRVCEGCWREWVGVGTKVINEMGLVLSDPKSQDVYDEHMVEFLQLDR